MVWYAISKTVNSKGQKTVLVNTTGHEKSRFTVVLTCLADGTRLKPMVIFKRKTIPKEKFPPGVIIHCHPKGWMDEAGLKVWIQKVWSARPGGLLRKRSLLIWDSFRAHLVDSVKEALRKTQTSLWYLVDLPVCYSHLTSASTSHSKITFVRSGPRGWLRVRRASQLVVIYITSRQPPSVLSALGSMNHGKGYPKIWFLAHLRSAVFQTR